MIEPTNTLSQKERDLILNKFPADLREQIKNVNNPLNQTEILVSLFHNKNVVIILENNYDKENDMYDYISYFHVSDLCHLLKVAETNFNRWKNNWKINFIPYDNLSTKKNIYIINPTEKKFPSNTLFVDEDNLKKILIKNGSTEANIFLDWLLVQSKISKTIINKFIKMKHDSDIQKLQKKVNTLENQVDHEQIYERLQVALCVMPKMEHIKGIIYIGSTKDLILKKISKIGKTIDAQRRKTELRVGNPTFNLYMEFECLDITLAEHFIHRFLHNLQVYNNKEFFYLPSLELGGELIKFVVDNINKMIETYGNFDTILRKDLVQNNFGNIIEYIQQNKEVIKQDKDQRAKWYINMKEYVDINLLADWDTTNQIITVGREHK
jgi:hypothetical protein